MTVVIWDGLEWKVHALMEFQKFGAYEKRNMRLT